MAANLRWGLGWGLAYAILYSLVAIGLNLLSGGATAEAYELSIWAIIGTYFATGIMGGILVGLLRPLLTSVWGAMLVGVMIAFPVLVGFGTALYGLPNQWEPALLRELTYAAVVSGTVGGYLQWHQR
jgi:hypothetical protein